MDVEPFSSGRPIEGERLLGRINLVAMSVAPPGRPLDRARFGPRRVVRNHEDIACAAGLRLKAVARLPPGGARQIKGTVPALWRP